LEIIQNLKVIRKVQLQHKVLFIYSNFTCDPAYFEIQVQGYVSIKELVKSAQGYFTILYIKQPELQFDKHGILYIASYKQAWLAISPTSLGKS
jgi:hypothetical protein